jgi:hypothetical protein
MARSRWIVLVAAVACLVVSSPAAEAAAGLHRTTTSNVNPVNLRTHHLKPGYRITHSVSGADCWTGSLTVPGAYRCMAGHYIHDPCWPFAKPGSDFSGMACLGVPWSHRVFWLRKTGPDSVDKRRGRALWGLRLADGNHCAVSTGANDTYHGKVVDFWCAKGHVALLGRPNRHHRVWRIVAVTYSHGRIVHPRTVLIAHAYYGVGSNGL